MQMSAIQNTSDTVDPAKPIVVITWNQCLSTSVMSEECYVAATWVSQGSLGRCAKPALALKNFREPYALLSVASVWRSLCPQLSHNPQVQSDKQRRKGSL